MPVDGVVDALNEELCYGNRNILLQQSESNAWIARIIPSDPGDTRELMLPRQYHTQGKDRYARQASR